MTSTSSETRPFRIADLGTLVVMAWSGDAPDGDMPYLLASSLGDGEGGPEASAVAVVQVLVDTGLPVGGDIVDGSTRPSLPVSLLVEAGSAVVNMPQVNAQCIPPVEWLTAVADGASPTSCFTTPPLARGPARQAHRAGGAGRLRGRRGDPVRRDPCHPPGPQPALTVELTAGRQW